MAELTVSDVNNGPVIIGVSTMMMALATTTVLLRIWIRLYRRIKLGLDDWLLLIAFLFLTGFFVLIIVQVNYGGLGKPLLVNLMQDLDILNRYMRMLIAQEIMCPVVLTFIKLSILSMYLRAFPVPSMRISCAVISVLVIIWGVAASVSAIVQCNPIEKAWTPFMTEGTCNHLMQSWLGWGSTIPEIATDVAIVILPIYKIIQLHNTLSTKVALCSIFALSGLVIISSIIRFVYGYRIFLEFESTDLTLNMGTVALWTWIELCTATICACLPVLRPAWAMILNKMRLGSSPTPKITPLVDVPTTIGGSGGGYDRRARLLRNGSKKSHDSVITDDSHIDESLALPEARSMA